MFWKLHRVLCFLLAASFLAGRAEDWTTTDGKSYRDVKVLKVEPDAVTVLYREGGALIPLASLPAELQGRFHYDPAQARIAAAARARRDAVDARMLKAETAQVEKRKANEKAADEATKAHAPALPVASSPGAHDPDHKDRDSLMKDNAPSDERDERDESFPSSNRDGKNTSGQTHPMNVN